MELLILIIGIVLVWKFSGILSALALAGRTKAEVMCEDVLMDSTLERVENVKNFKEVLGEKEIKNHEEILSMLKMKH